MTEEERAQRDADLRLAYAMMNAAPKPSLETRLGWLEADASAQRTAILRLEIALVQAVVCLVVVGIAFGVLAVLT